MEITKETYKQFLKNNKISKKEYSLNQYLRDMKKERAKNPNSFNPNF